MDHPIIFRVGDKGTKEFPALVRKGDDALSPHVIVDQDVADQLQGIFPLYLHFGGGEYTTVVLVVKRHVTKEGVIFHTEVCIPLGAFGW